MRGRSLYAKPIAALAPRGAPRVRRVEMEREEILRLVLAASRWRDGERVIGCAELFRLAEAHGLTVAEVGVVCDKDVVRIVSCQLGCFH